MTLDPLAQLLVQLLVVVLSARLLGAAARRLRQPAVIGEIAAGILLGPSVLGALSPGLAERLFPASSLGVLRLLAELGVLLFMFGVGLEMELGLLRQRARTVVVISQTGIWVPYLLGAALSVALFRTYAPPGARLLPFALFMGTAMSITAFPVLARILDERGLSRTPLGSTALGCAAVDDATAWLLLAIVASAARSEGVGAAVFKLVAAPAGVGIAVWLAYPLLRGALRRTRGAPDGRPAGPALLVFAFVLLSASALLTTALGLHALFGAFLAGLLFPWRREVRDDVEKRLAPVTSSLLLPLFFAVTGLRTRIGLLNDTRSWLFCLAIIGIASLGKLGGCLLAARLSGMTWIDALSLGALMNTRGLMELVALGVGYELGILPPAIFAMMVLMALATTALAGPLLSLTERLAARTGARAALAVNP